MHCLLSKLQLPIVAVIGAAAFCACAQGDAGAAKDNSSQPIIFSEPQNISGAVPMVTPQNTPERDSSTLGTPPTFLNPQQNFPMPVPKQRPQTPKKNPNDWTLMTPAEILGMETPEQILKSPEQKAYDEEREGKTPLERFLKRQDNSQFAAATNGPGRRDSDRWDFSENKKRFGMDGNDSSFDSQRKNAADFLQNSLNDWSINPSRQSTRDSSSKMLSGNQSARLAMASSRFEDLLAPSQKPETISPQFSSAKNNSAAKPLIDPELQPQPLFNPLGTTYKPIESGVAKPVGIQPLPTLNSPAVAPPVATPAWAPKPPPWLSQAPRPFAIPQRKF